MPVVGLAMRLRSPAGFVERAGCRGFFPRGLRAVERRGGAMLDACKEGGMTAVVVTHDAQLASWADRVVFLRDGTVTDQTAPAQGPEILLTPERNQWALR